MVPRPMRPAHSDTLSRYSQQKWLERSLHSGEFRLVSASYIQAIENDAERQDDERRRNYEIESKSLKVTHGETNREIPLRSNLKVSSSLASDYYLLCFTAQRHDMMYDIFEGSDACLTIRDRVRFSERLYQETDRALPGWGAVDASVIYGGMSHEFGPAFMKPEKYVFQFEWRYVWLPPEPVKELENLTISVGSIEDIAELEPRA